MLQNLKNLKQGYSDTLSLIEFLDFQLGFNSN